MHTPHISWEGPLFANSSLGLVNREILTILKDHVSLSICPTDNLSKNNNPSVEKLLPYIDTLASRPPIDICISHKFPPNLNEKRSKYRIIMLPWELGALPKQWVQPLQKTINEIWVYSEHIKKVCLESGIPKNKLHVIHLGVNPTVFNNEAITLTLPSQKKFKFLFLGGTIYRKGIDILLEAYTTGFKPTDPVTLIIKDFKSNQFYADAKIESHIKSLINNPNFPEIIHLTDDIPAENMGGLYNACDCLVAPYRAEGFCLPILEAMACNLPTIVPNYGACLDFTSNSSNYRINATEILLKTKHIEDIELADYPYWGEVRPNDLATAMQNIFHNYDKALTLAKRANLKAHKHFTWRHTVEKILSRITAITSI